MQQLREVLYGAHVLVDEPELYERWRFPKSRERLSSHHKTVDKARYPDLGLKGPLVREKLHGRTDAGTWVQLEKTPAAMGNGFRLPGMSDVRHLMDYVVYRLTKRNVGPWGLSGITEKRPMYLSPDLGVMMPLPAAAEAELTGALERVEEDDDTTSASPTWQPASRPRSAPIRSPRSCSSRVPARGAVSSARPMSGSPRRPHRPRASCSPASTGHQAGRCRRRPARRRPR